MDGTPPFTRENCDFAKRGIDDAPADVSIYGGSGLDFGAAESFVCTPIDAS